MRFRATVTNLDTFTKIVQSIEKLQKKCILKFSPHEMRIICTGDVSEGGMQVWSQIKATSLFDEYRVQSNTRNEVTFSLLSEALLAALHSASGPASTKNAPNTWAAETEVSMKLAKRGTESVLQFDIVGTTAMGRQVRVLQQIAIEVMRHADVDRLKEPMCTEPDVHILLPPLAKLRTVVERLRPLAAEGIKFRANSRGQLQLAAATDQASVEIGWDGLANPKTAQNPNAPNAPAADVEPRDPADFAGVLVSHRCLLRFLNSHVVSTTTIACICESHCVILYVYIGSVADAGGVLTYYIPAQFVDSL